MADMVRRGTSWRVDDLWFDGVKDQGTVGALFVVNVVAGLAIAVMLLRWRSWVPLFLLVGFGAATLGCFLISATVGLFGIHTGWSWYAWPCFASGESVTSRFVAMRTACAKARSIS